MSEWYSMKLSRRHPGTSGTKTGYGSTSLGEESKLLPGESSRRLRAQRLVDAFMTEEKLSVAGLARRLGVGRSTVYRVFGEPVFQDLFRREVNGRLALAAAGSLRQLTDLLDDPKTPPNVRLRVSMWIVERHDRLVALIRKGKGPALFATEDGVLERAERALAKAEGEAGEESQDPEAQG